MKIYFTGSVNNGDWAVLLLPAILVSKEKNMYSILIGWLCGAIMIEFGSKEMKKV